MATGTKEVKKSAFAVSLFRSKSRRGVPVDVNLLPDKEFKWGSNSSKDAPEEETQHNAVSEKAVKASRRSSLPGLPLGLSLSGNNLDTSKSSIGSQGVKEKINKTPPVHRIVKKSLKSDPRGNPLRRSLKRKFRSRSEKSLHSSADDSKDTSKADVEINKFVSDSSLYPKKTKFASESESVHNDSLSPKASPTEAQPATVMFSTDKTDEESTEPCEDGQKMFQWLISPVKEDKFFSDVWERKPLLIKRRDANFFKGWFSTKDLDNILRKNNVKFTENIDITVYQDGKRKTLNPAGRAHAPIVWQHFKEGCSVRLLNPQSYSESIWKLNSTLQEFFGCYVGSNVYLTPAGSQGFAPHYDDIEAFVIQIEGKKNWKLYNPRTIEEQLPRYSSENLTEEVLDAPILDCVLEPGDVLYFPRGTIHQASTPNDTHSLHITLSAYQQFSWGDYLEVLMPRALEVAMEEDVDFRKGLPMHFLNNIGLAHSEKTNKERNDLLKRILELMFKLTSYAPIDSAADQVAVNVIKNQQQPFLSEDDKACSIHGNGAFWDNDTVCGEAHFLPITKVRLIRPGVARMAVNEEKAIIYHSVSNSRVFGQSNIAGIEFSIDDAEALDNLIYSYPEYVSIESLPCSSYAKKLELVRALYDHGILRTQMPLKQDSAL